MSLAKSSVTLLKALEKPRGVDTAPSTRKLQGPWNVGKINDPNRDAIPPKAEGAIRFVCLSDTHSHHTDLIPHLPDGDVLLHAGDFSNVGHESEIISFNDFLGKVQYKHKVVIAGNHDVPFHPDYYDATFANRWRMYHKQKLDSEKMKGLLTNCIYLEDDEVTVEGIRIYGSPWQPEFCDWAFNLHGPELEQIWKRIPTGSDIVMTHGPAYNHCDFTSNKERAGCSHLLKELTKRVMPKVHVSGHIHEGYGISRENGMLFMNASNCSLRYKAEHAPIVFDLV